jgi:hypothetical protein
MKGNMPKEQRRETGMDLKWFCPVCGKETVILGRAIELPPDLESDEILLRPISCSACAFHGAAFLEESRRGSMDSNDCSRHLGYPLTEHVFSLLQEVIAACPDATNPSCDCSSHRRLAGDKRGDSREWLRRNGVDCTRQFSMRRGHDGAQSGEHGQSHN